MLIFMSASFPDKSVSSQSELKSASTISGFGEPRRERVISRKSLYRRLGWFVILLVAFPAVVVSPGAAQGRPQLKRPEETPPEKPPEKKKPKKGKEPRAVGILELNSNGKGTLVPVAILIDGKFYDASAYKADPVPMALEAGTVYEAEESGNSEGLFTVNGALHSKNAANANPWVGTGTYLPKGAEAPKTTRKAEDVPVGLGNSGDEPPRLTRKNASKPAAGSDAGSAGSSNSGSASSGSSGKTSGTASAPSQPASGSSTGSNSGQDAAKGANAPAADKAADSSGKPATPAGADKGVNPPAANGAGGQSSSGQTSSGQTSSSQTSSSQGSGDYYRPQLRRGKPTAAAPPDEADEVLAAKKDGKADTGAASSRASAEPSRVVAAISDEAGPDPQSYKFFWKSGEEEERRNQMLAAAGDEVRAYVAALAKNQISARPVAPKAVTGSHKAQAKQAQPVFENIQFHGFDVWLTDQPVMILSAEAHIPAAPGAPAAAIEPYSVTLVARTDIYGNLRKLYSGVTDKFHLDVTPRLELIDAVDADGDGRAELLFHETTDAGGGYVIYRATPDKLWKMFDSLNAE
jgi:hypothetical protein